MRRTEAYYAAKSERYYDWEEDLFAFAKANGIESCTIDSSTYCDGATVKFIDKGRTRTYGISAVPASRDVIDIIKKHLIKLWGLELNTYMFGDEPIKCTTGRFSEPPRGHCPEPAKANVSYATYTLPAIRNVYFNNPVTVVIWADGTKTIVRCTNEEYDPEKGLAMCISKKALGNKGRYFDTFKYWFKRNEEENSNEEN